MNSSALPDIVCSETVGSIFERCRLELSGDALSSMEQRTKGWIAGVQLVALALRESNRGFMVLCSSKSNENLFFGFSLLENGKACQ